MALQPAGEVELEQHDVDLAHAEAGGADQLIDIDRTWSERADDPLALALTNLWQRLGRGAFVGGGELTAYGRKRPPQKSAPASRRCRARW